MPAATNKVALDESERRRSDCPPHFMKATSITLLTPSWCGGGMQGRDVRGEGGANMQRVEAGKSGGASARATSNKAKA